LSRTKGHWVRSNWATRTLKMDFLRQKEYDSKLEGGVAILIAKGVKTQTVAQGRVKC